jgi:hypothetical protein
MPTAKTGSAKTSLKHEPEVAGRRPSPVCNTSEPSGDEKAGNDTQTRKLQTTQNHLMLPVSGGPLGRLNVADAEKVLSRLV